MCTFADKWTVLCLISAAWVLCSFCCLMFYCLMFYYFSCLCNLLCSYFNSFAFCMYTVVLMEIMCWFSFINLLYYWHFYNSFICPMLCRASGTDNPIYCKAVQCVTIFVIVIMMLCRVNTGGMRLSIGQAVLSSVL